MPAGKHLTRKHSNGSDGNNGHDDDYGDDAGWEDAMIQLLKGIRAQETSYAIRMARIRAFNMALYFFITPLVSFIVFTVVCWSIIKIHSACLPEC